jgi:preprotein translocase subunit SecY
MQPKGHFTDFRSLILSGDNATRIGFTLGVLALWRLGCCLPLPGINLDTFAQLLRPQPGQYIVNDAAVRMSVFSLGVMPYVGSYVLLHVLCAFSERLRNLRRAGPQGWQRFSQLIRAGALIIAVFQSYRIAIGLEAVPNLVSHPGLFFRTGTVISLVAGTMLLIWLGEQISARGVGSGVWLIFAAGYVVQLVVAVFAIAGAVAIGVIAAWVMVAGIVVSVGLITLVVFVEGAERRLPVKYEADRRINPTFLSLKIDNTSVLASLVASALLAVLPPTLYALLQPGGVLGLGDPGSAVNIARALAPGQPLYLVSHAALIIFFVFFFTAITLDNRQLASDLAQSGGTIVGMPDGRSPAELLDGVLTRLTLIGALYLVVLCVMPEILINFGAPFYLGGVPLLVTTLVAIGVLSDLMTSTPPSRGPLAACP